MLKLNKHLILWVNNTTHSKMHCEHSREIVFRKGEWVKLECGKLCSFFYEITTWIWVYRAWIEVKLLPRMLCFVRLFYLSTILRRGILCEDDFLSKLFSSWRVFYDYFEWWICGCQNYFYIFKNIIIKNYFKRHLSIKLRLYY